MKHYAQKMLALLLALSMVLAWLPVSAQALLADAGLEKTSIQTDSATYINPLYADVMTEADLVRATGEPAANPTAVAVEDYAATFEEAAVAVREGMVNRQETIVAYYKSMEYVKEDHKKVYNAAVAHTGVPTEGDSLRWVFGGYSVSISRYVGDDGIYYITYTYTMTYYTTAEQEAELTAAVDTLLDDLNVDVLSDYGKLCAVYDYMCQNIVYDETNPDDYKLKHTAYAALMDKTAVCQGYAVLLYRLLLEMGIDNRLVSGIGNGGAHGWNIVKLGDAYYNVDSTWDAIWHQAGYEYNFFLRADDTFEDHTRDAEFLTEDFYAAYPMASADYIYTPPAIVATGTCGDDLTWTLDSEGLMVIEGTGKMWTFDDNSKPSWNSYLTSIKTVVIKEGATSIGDCAFKNCTSLTDINIPDSVTSIGNIVFKNCTGLTGVTIPESVTTIGYTAFSGCTNLTRVNIPEGVTTISNALFTDCSSLTEVTIPEGVTTIGYSVFRDCTNLASVNIPDGVTSIGDYAFYGCSSLTSVTIPEGVTSIGDSTFSGCSSLTSITIPEGVTTISDCLFKGCTNLAKVSLPDSLTSIGASAFRDCNSLTELTIPEGVTSIGGWAFYYCKSLTSITIPEGVTSIGDRTFEGCTSLTSITMPDGITSIGEYAFQSCVELPSITIPSGVTTIGNWAFAYCTKLTKVYFTGDAPTIGQSAYTNSAISTCYYPVTNATWTSDVMRNYGRNADWVPYGHFDIAFTSMTMGNSLAMNFAFEQDEMTDWTGCYAEIVKNYADGREDVVVTIPYAEWKTAGIAGIAHYYVTFNGIAAKEMTDEVYVTVYNANGTAISNTKTDTVRDQAMRNLARSTITEQETTMVVDMLNYGTAAQNYFQYNTADPANNQLTDEQAACATPSVTYEDTHTGNENYFASNLLLKSNIQLQLAFRNVTTEMTAVVTYTNHWGTEKTVTIDGSAFTQSGSYYVVTLEDLVVSDGRQDVTCTIYDGDTVVAWATDSMESYAARKTTDGELFEMLMKFSDSAYAYFHNS